MAFDVVLLIYNGKDYNHLIYQLEIELVRIFGYAYPKGPGGHQHLDGTGGAALTCVFEQENQNIARINHCYYPSQYVVGLFIPSK